MNVYTCRIKKIKFTTFKLRVHNSMYSLSLVLHVPGHLVLVRSIIQNTAVPAVVHV